MAVTGLNADGFDCDEWIKGGNGGIFETANFTSPGYVARLDYTGIDGLRTGISFYYCHNTGRNIADNQNRIRIPVAIGSWDAQYCNQYITARANFTYGYVGNTIVLTDIAGETSPVAKNAIGYGTEAGINIASFIKTDFPDIAPFVRYEYFNPNLRTIDPLPSGNHMETSKWTAGINWTALPDLIVKAAYSNHRTGTSNPFGKGLFNTCNEFQIGIAWTGWFIEN